MPSITKNDRLYRRTSMIVAATTANQSVFALDLSSYGGTSTRRAGFHFILKCCPVHGSPSVTATDIYSVTGRRGSGATGLLDWADLVTTALKTASGAVDFTLVSNVLTCRIDGGAGASPMIFEIEGIIGEYDSA
jgi:hypothetical protein